MGSGRSRTLIVGATTVLVTLAMLTSGAWASSTKVLYSFGGDEDGEYPSTDLVLDSAGNLYGSTVLGGDFGSGTVFEVTPSGTHSVLHEFTGGTDGGQPYGGVTLDPEGHLFGTAVIGGTFGGACPEDGCGVAYELTNVSGTWTETVIHTFTGGDDGFGPGAGLTLDQRGNLYGMTPTGGAYGVGVIYQLTPDGAGSWTEQVIHTFTGGMDGGTGSPGRLLLGRSGELYGVGTVGGANGAGTAFVLRHRPAGSWSFRTLYAFKGQPDAGSPYAALISDPSGHLYGTTYYGGANGFGAVYELARTTGGWREKVLYSFAGGSDGIGPISNLVSDPTGDLYGTTSEGGAPVCGCGTIFELIPGGGVWTEVVVHSFSGAPDGAFSYNGLTASAAGDLYGATVHGGTDDEGSIYEFTP